MDAGPELVEHSEHGRMGMSVPVLAPDAEDGHAGTDRPEEGRIRAARPMVRHGHRVRAETLAVHRQQACLTCALDVTGHQETACALPDTQHDRGIVRLPGGVPVGPPGRRVQDLDHQLTQGGHLAGARRGDRHPTACGHGHHLVRPGGRLRRGSEPHGPDVETA